jgi:hypothetical protein
VNQKLKINTIEAFLRYLDETYRTGEWVFKVETDGCIHLWRKGDQNIFVREYAYSPVTAVYYHLTALRGEAKIQHRGSFWQDEITREFGMSWWDMLELSYTWAKISCGGHQFNTELYDEMVKILTETQAELSKKEEQLLRREKVVTLACAA